MFVVKGEALYNDGGESEKQKWKAMNETGNEKWRK